MVSKMVLSTVTQAAQNTDKLKALWQTINENSCPYHYNFHMHTVCSDGSLEPVDLIKQAVDIGLKGMAITDHHSINGYFAAQHWLNSGTTSLSARLAPHLWTGVEVTAKLLDTEVHILGYGFAPHHRAMQPYLTGERPGGTKAQAQAVITAIHQAGGLAVLAHPARYRRSAEELIKAIVPLGIDGVEAYYAYANPQPWQPSPKETALVTAMSEKYGLYQTCGTDSHGMSLLQRV